MRDIHKYDWLPPDRKSLRGDRYIAICVGVMALFWLCVWLVLR